MDAQKKAGIMAVLARRGSREDGRASLRYSPEERARQEKQNKKKGQQSYDINAALQAAGIAPRPGPQPGVPREGGVTPEAVTVASLLANQPRDPNVIPSQPRQPGPFGAFGPRDPNVRPTDPRQPMAPLYAPRDPNVRPTTPRAPYNASDPRFGADRNPDPGMNIKMGDVVNAIYAQNGLGQQQQPQQTPATDPRLSADRRPNLYMLYKGQQAAQPAAATDPKKKDEGGKQWSIPKKDQGGLPSNYEVVGPDPNDPGRLIVRKKSGNQTDEKADQAMNQAYLTAGTSVASTAAPLVAEYFAGSGTAAASGAGAAGATGAATGAASTGAATSGSVAGAGASATTAGSAAGGGAAAGGTGSTLGTAAMYAWPLAALYGAYRVWDKTTQKSKKGNMTDSDIHMALNPRGIETVLQKIPGHRQLKEGSPEFQIWKAMFGSTKNEDQIYRDRVRKQLKDHSFIDENYNLTLADGTAFDIGKDGSIKNYNVDVEANPDAGEIVGEVNPLAHILTAPHGGDKLKSDYSGFFTNAVLSGSKDQQANNVRGLYEKAGLDRESARAGVTALFDQDTIDEGTRDAYYAAIDKVFGVGGIDMQEVGGSGGGGGKKPKPSTGGGETKPKPAPTLSSIVPTNPPPPVMPEPDDEKTPEEQQAVNDYAAILSGQIKEAQTRRKEGKKKVETKRYYNNGR